MGKGWNGGPVRNQLIRACAEYILYLEYDDVYLNQQNIREDLAEEVCYWSPESLNISSLFCFGHALASGGCGVRGEVRGEVLGDRKTACQRGQPQHQYCEANQQYRLSV